MQTVLHMHPGVTINCTGQHQTTPGPCRARNDWLFRFYDEL